jgi:hypothetical protein
MKYKVVPNFFMAIIGIIVGIALFKEFDFENLKFEKPALAVVYAIVFVAAFGFMIKKSNNKIV